MKRGREDDDGQGDSAILQQSNPNSLQDSHHEYQIVKRGRDQEEEEDDHDGEVEIEIETAKELIELSKSMKGPRMFACKTCDRRFPSFQALGGHRASHNNPKLDHESSSPAKRRKTHKCTLCGLEFQIGQALGGHMRKHRGVVNCLESTRRIAVPVMKRLASNKRVLGLDLDLNLNLKPPSNIDQDLKIEKEAPFLYSFF